MDVWQSRRSLTKKGLILFSFIIFLESCFLLVLAGLLDYSEKLLTEERHARAVVAEIAKLSSEAQFAAMALVNQTRYRTVVLDEYQSIFLRLPRELNRLKLLLKDRPEELVRLKEVESSITDALELIEKVHQSVNDKGTAEKKMMHYHYCIQLIDLSHILSGQIDEFAKVYKGIEKQASMTAANQSDTIMYVCLVLGVLVNATIAVAVYMFFVKGITSRLSVVAENTVNIVVGKPLLDPVSGDDEVAELDCTFREMAHSLDEIRTKEKTILEHAANFICSLDAKGIFISVPAACSTMWGYTPEELIGRRLTSITSGDGAENTNKALESLVSSGGSKTFETQIRCSDGSNIYVSWNANLIENGTIVCVAHDITERDRITKLIRESEMRFRTIIERLPVAVVSSDRSFQIESFNNSTIEMFQFSPEELKDTSLAVLIGEDKAVNEIVDIALERTTELNTRRKDDSQLPVELNMSAYTAPQGERLLACFRDISSRVELELAKRDFVSMIGHDLRSPLMSLYGTLGMLVQDTDGDGERKSEAVAKFAQAEKTIEDLVVLINDFLELGKLENASGSLNLTEEKLSTVWSEILNASNQSNCDIVIENGDYSPSIKIDLDRIVLSLICFIDVLKHFNPSVAQVTVAAEQKIESILIRISGDQCRLPKEVKETCIEGNSLVDTNDVKASPLRLALSRAIIEAHQGKVCVAATGADCFEIVLPSVRIS